SCGSASVAEEPDSAGPVPPDNWNLAARWRPRYSPRGMVSQERAHEYKSDFFEYINVGSTASARVVCPILIDWVSPDSVLDVGCGAGAWCRVWRESGVRDVIGVDGDYVDQTSLLIDAGSFISQDLSKSFDLD